MPAVTLDSVAVALDTADRGQFSTWCSLFGPRVGFLKVGLEAFVRWGPEAVAEAREHARGLFLDLKLHDIPNTVAGAVRSAEDLGADLLTVHAGGGGVMLEAAVAASSRVRLLAVTVLTHLDAAGLRQLGSTENPRQRVAAWTALAATAGCAGVVCSPREAADTRQQHAEGFLIVTPGIRSAGVGAGDQRRTMTPAQARDAGADLLVIGRQLTRADDPLVALDRVAAELAC